MGWGDMFRERHNITGDYFLMEGEEETSDDLYLFAELNSISVAGPLKLIGWDGQYIIFTDSSQPVPWSVIAVKRHERFTVTEMQRTQDARFRQIVIGSSSEAWQRAKKAANEF